MIRSSLEFDMPWLVLILSLLISPAIALGQTAPATNPQAGVGSGNVIVAMGLVDVEAGVSRLMIEMPGRIRQIEAKENQVYNAGDVLLAVDDTTFKLKHAQAMKAVALAEKKLAQARHGVGIAEAEGKAQQAAIDAAVERETTYKNRLKETKGAAPSGTVRELEDAVRESGFFIKAEREKLKVIEARVAYARSDVTLAEAQVDIQTEQLKEAEKAIDDCVLKAPFKGKVLRIRARLGELVGPAMLEPLIEFCPDAPRIVRGEISQEFAAAAKVGQVCKITDDSRTSSITWTGKVERLGDWYAPRRSILFEPLQLNDQRTVECLIVVDQNSELLRIGQRVRISLEMNRQTGPVVNRNGEKK